MNLSDSSPIAQVLHAGYVLNHNYTGPECVHYAQVFAEQAGPFVMEPALVVIDAECLAGRAAEQHIEFATLKASCLKKHVCA